MLAFAKRGCDDPRMVCAAWRQIVARIENAILVLPIQSDEYCEMLKRKGVDFIMPGARIEIADRLSLEVWKYPPERLSRDAQMVDPLSLFLSMKNDADPRVQGELEKVLEGVSWQ